MGSLITETPYSEVTATLEILDHLGVGREDLRKFRAARPEVHSHMVRILKAADSLVSISTVETSGLPKADSIPDAPIRVDRSIRPVYPDWTKIVMHPELEPTGPSEYDIATITLWLHDGQKNGGWVKGQVIYDYLKSNNMLESCLGLRDLEEIRKKGVAFFRKHFAGKALFAWKSAVQLRDGDLGVPYLIVGFGDVVVRWDRLGGAWGDDNPAARFAS